MEDKKECCCSNDDLYGGDPCVLEQAIKQCENVRKYIKKVMKPCEDKAEELKKATSTQEVRLQGTKETKAPDLKPFTETIHVKTRNELANLIETAKSDKRNWAIRRSATEGYRYDFITDKILVEASSGEKQAFKHGGERFTDYIDGKSIARIKDPDYRNLFIAIKRFENTGKTLEGFPTLKELLDRKENQAIINYEKKAMKMANAGVRDEALKESTEIRDSIVKLDDLQYFKPYAGAKDTWNLIVKNNKLDDFAKCINDLVKDGKITTSELNDFIWFEKDWILDKLGIEVGNVEIKKGDDVIDAEPVEVKKEGDK